MKKYITIFFSFILMSLAAWAQDASFPKRDIPLKIVNKRGRPVKNIIVRSLSADKAGITDRNGLFVFREMSDNDTLSVMLSGPGEAIFPVAGMDSIVVTLRSARLYSYIDTKGQSVYIERDQNNTKANTLLDVPALLRQVTYNSLAELLQGRVAGLNIASGNSGGVASGNIRGINSLMGSTEPLVVLDGKEVGIFSDANSIVDVYSIKTIEVLKSAPEWGTRGGNGVILIETIK